MNRSVAQRLLSVDVSSVPLDFSYVAQQLPETEQFPVSLVHCVSLGQLYLQLEENKKQLEQMMVKLNEPEVIQKLRCFSFYKLQVGMACISYSSKQERWLRGIVLSCNSADSIRCMFLDYGFDDVVSVKWLRRLTESFSLMPYQAIQCKLAFIKPVVNDRYSIAANERFSDLALYKQMWACTVPEESSKDCTAVVLTLIEGDTDVHLNDLLVLEHYVKLKLDEDYTKNISLDSAKVYSDSLGVETGNSTFCWDDDLETLSDECSASSKSLMHKDSNEVVYESVFVFPELETEMQLMQYAREMVLTETASAESLNVIHTVLQLKLRKMQKSVSGASVHMQTDWLEKNAGWLEDQEKNLKQ